MKRKWISRVCLGLAFLIAIYIGLLIGVKIGTEAGWAQYHNEHTRLIHYEIMELRETIRMGNLDDALDRIDRMSKLAASAGDRQKFYKLLANPENAAKEQKP